MSETSTLTGPLRAMLEEAGCLVFRMPAGKIPKGRRWIQLCPEGTADLLVFPRSGGVVWIETKDPQGTTRKSRKEAQAAFKCKVEGFGHRYVTCKSLSQGLDILTTLQPDHFAMRDSK